MLERRRTDGVEAIFHEDEGEGYFFLYRQASREVMEQVQLYSVPTVPRIREEDVDIFWSRDEAKAGIAIWGRIRAILGATGKSEEICPVQSPDSPAIEPDTSATFPEYVDRKPFLEARKRYWKDALIRARPEIKISDRPSSLLETRFLVAAVDTGGTRAAVFEDDGDTGYLYLYSIPTAAVQNHVHVYDRSKSLQVEKESVHVLWSINESKCAVRIWGQLRGIIDLHAKKEGRAWLDSRDAPGITDKEWLRGFNLM